LPNFSEILTWVHYDYSAHMHCRRRAMMEIYFHSRYTSVVKIKRPHSKC